MSDFTSSFWPVFITVISLVGIFGCALLLWVTSKVKVASSNGDNTSGHVWDVDLREMNNPLPRWWVGLFIITIILGLAHLVASWAGHKSINTMKRSQPPIRHWHPCMQNLRPCRLSNWQ